MDDFELDTFIKLQKFTNKIIISQLESISNQIENNLIEDFNDVKEDIQRTLDGIRNVTSREMNSYDAISGMMVALDKQLETINEYIKQNIRRSISYAASIPSTKYGDNITIVQEWFTDYLISIFEKTTDHSGESLEKYFKNYFILLKEKYGKNHLPQYLEMNERISIAQNMWEDVRRDLDLDDFTTSIMLTSYVLYVTLINGVSPLTYPIEHWKTVVMFLRKNKPL